MKLRGKEKDFWRGFWLQSMSSICPLLNSSFACYILVTRLKIVRCINPSYAFLLVLYALNIYLYPANCSSCSLHHSHLTGKVAVSLFPFPYIQMQRQAGFSLTLRILNISAVWIELPGSRQTLAFSFIKESLLECFLCSYNASTVNVSSTTVS